MKKYITLFICIPLLVSACSQSKNTTNEYPLFWTWLDYRPTMNFDSICRVLNETGIDGLILNASSPDEYRQAIPVANKYGIEVYAWLWTMNLEHDRDSILKVHPEWLSVNRNGQSLADTIAYVGYYKFLCPAIPEVREYIKNKIRAYCEVDGLNGIAIDYHRFVDVILPTTLWPKYGIVQDREYAEWDFGYHPAMIEKFMQKHAYDPRELEDPSTDEEWLQFRCDQITEVANEIAGVVHSYGKKMAASPFPTPAMSRQMVRQDWNKWNLDIVFPMVYHNFYTEDISFISDCTIENVQTKNPVTTLYCGMMVPNDLTVIDCMDAALNNGAEGIAIFTINNLKDPNVRKAFKAYSDSIKAHKAQLTEKATVANQTEVNDNPFEKAGIMNLIYKKIASQTGLPKDEIELDEFKLVDEYGVTKHYDVIEKNSNATFDVAFYFYGGILSGWDVKRKDVN